MLIVEQAMEPRPFELEELLARCVGNLELVERVLKKFATHFADDLERLERHLQVGDADELARVAHTMKGASANVAAPGLREQTARIEELARGRQLDQISSRLTLLRNEWSRFSSSLSAVKAPPDRDGV